jgi:three-Cys-motif partner protein
MAIKDLHENAFDEATIIKLGIFEDYAKAWIPVFVMRSSPTIRIFDFFAGPGYDKDGVAGSPIRILKKIKEHINNIIVKKVNFIVHFNEYDIEKFNLLSSVCNSYLDENDDLKNVVTLNLYNKDFDLVFNELLPLVNKQPSLVYLDQNGVKALSRIHDFIDSKQTDFLLFVSSSYIRRFGETEEFKKHLNIDLSSTKYRYVHRALIEKLKENIPSTSKLKLYPFSLKKGSNIYGIIFGASHPLAVDKFLSIAWKQNGTNGEANYDIDEDSKKIQFDVFNGKIPTKLERFKSVVREKVLTGEIKSNYDLYNYTLEEGHIGSHAAECLKQMKKDNEVYFDGSSPLVTYYNVYKNNKKTIYRLENETK